MLPADLRERLPRFFDEAQWFLEQHPHTAAVLTVPLQVGAGGSRILALVNVAMSDAGIASWESKFYWKFWRPITGIRESDPGTGPSGLGDGNAQTVGDPTFTPLGAPASKETAD